MSRPRWAAIAALAVVLAVYFAVAESLHDFGDDDRGLWMEVVLLGAVIIPAVLLLVWLALPLWKAPWAGWGGLVLAIVAVVLEIAGLDILSDLAKLGALTLIAFWFLTFFETAAWVTIVALIIPVVDAFSVFRGPTGHVIEERPSIFERIAFAFPVPGESDPARLGPPDLLFFALFLGAAARFRLRVAWTWVAMTASFGLTLALAVWLEELGLPALPFLALGFLLPNADLLWRDLRRGFKVRSE